MFKYLTIVPALFSASQKHLKCSYHNQKVRHHFIKQHCFNSQLTMCVDFMTENNLCLFI